MMSLPKVVGVLRAKTPELALEMARASIRGGLQALEITCTVPNAEQVIQTLVAEQNTCQIGAGTVLTAMQAKAMLQSGASFLVSPHFGLHVHAMTREAGMTYIPGVHTHRNHQCHKRWLRNRQNFPDYKSWWSSLFI